MKKILFIFTVLSMFSFTPVSDYCDGWEDGYCEGWKDVRGQFSYCPPTPICPIPTIQCNEGYRCGYNRGFKKGIEDAS